MSSRSTVLSVLITGDATGLQTASAQSESSIKAIGTTSDKTSGQLKSLAGDNTKSFDGVRDAGDVAERRMTGLSDAITGTGDVMAGFKSGNVLQMSQGFADLGGAVANLGGDMLDWGKKAFTGARDVVKAHGMSVIAKGKDVVATGAHAIASGAAAVATGVQTAAQWLLNAAMNANPVMLVVIAIAALAAGLWLAYEKVGFFHDAVDKAWQILQTGFHWITDNWPLLLAILTGPIGLAVLAITTHWDTIKNGFTAVKDWISEKINDIVGFITGLPSRITSATSGMFDGIKTAFGSVINAIIGGWNSFTSKLGIPEIDTHIPGIGKVGGWSLGDAAHISPISLGAGGIALSQAGGTLARIGEAGQDEAVLPLPDNWRSGGMGGGTVINNFITVKAVAPATAGREITKALAAYARSGGRG